MSRRVGSCVALAALVVGVFGDVYLHNPRGSNDRNCERNENRNNGNLLFDSQNNAKGGYACPRAVGGPNVVTSRMYYYAGSKVPIEFTAQHGCGPNPKVRCDVIMQYACEDTLDPSGQYRFQTYAGAPRDGIPTDSADSATDTIKIDDPENEHFIPGTDDDRRYGVHETIDFYRKCMRRQRNRGLWTADQQLNRNDARATRQNPNGERRGLECPEERDYYPYWHPTPWRDIAVITTDIERCAYFQAASENVLERGECVPATPGADAALNAQGQWYNNQAACVKSGNTWKTSRWGDDKFKSQPRIPPVCIAGGYSRINHHGNAWGVNATMVAPGPEGARDKAAIPNRGNPLRYIWTVPNNVNGQCVIRIRYNITTSDVLAFSDAAGTPGWNSSYNFKNSPVKREPFVTIGPLADDFLSLRINTNQWGRTFQDRTYVFSIAARPVTVPDSTRIYNLNVRGKRGNIVQTYPAVEYDYVPDDMNLNVNDIVHVQWTGSDYNPRRGCNDGEGGPPDPNTPDAANQNTRADRSNLVETNMMDSGYPRPPYPNSPLPANFKTMFYAADATVDLTTIMYVAFLGQKQQLAAFGKRCLNQTELNAINDPNVRRFHPRNCAKLNAAYTPYFDGGLITMRMRGAFTYICTRNNNLSNRDQTGRICVGVVCTDPAADSDPGARGVANVPTYTAFSQLPADVQSQTAAAVIAGDVLATAEKDNDSVGDGDLMPCMMYGQVMSVSVGAAVAIAFGMFFFGIAVTVGGQRFAARYRAKHGLGEKDPLPFMPMELVKWARIRLVGAGTAKLVSAPTAGAKAPAVPLRPTMASRVAPPLPPRPATGGAPPLPPRPDSSGASAAPPLPPRSSAGGPPPLPPRPASSDQ